MRRSLFLVVFVLIALLVTGCGKTAQDEAPVQTYEPLVLVTPEPTPSQEDIYRDTIAQNMHDGTGSYMEDIDGNGILELFIGPTVGDIYEKQAINIMYTIADNQPVKVFESTEKDKYYLCENGTLVQESTQNAYNSTVTFYTFNSGQLIKMMTIGVDLKGNPEKPWYKEEGETKTPVEETDAIDAIQAYRATYRNLNYA